MSEMKAGAPAGLSRRIAEFVVAFSLERAPSRVVENAKLAILDCIAVSLLAATEEIGRNAFRFAQANADVGPCTVWGSAIRTGPRDAALVNATLAHGLDYDDRGHASTFTLAAAVAASELCNETGTRALEGYIVGREVRMALDPLFATRTKGVGPGARGWHSNGIIGPIAAACSVAKVFGFNVDETLASVGLAAGSCGGLTRDGGTMAKPFRAGQAAMIGLTCALLAKSGFTSDAQVLEGHRGLLDALGPLTPEILEMLCRNLGERYDLERDVGVKTFPSCTATHGAIEAMLRLVRSRSVSAEQVAAIECDLRSSTLLRIEATRGFEGRFSMPFCLAVAFTEKSVRPAHFVDDMTRQPNVRRLMSRTQHAPHSDTVIVRLNDGTHLCEPISDPKDLSTREEVEEKFEQCVRGFLPAERRRALSKQIAELERLPSIRILTDSLHGTLQSTIHEIGGG